MSKLPWMQFCVGDWFKDPGIQLLDATERGIWLHMLFLMWDSNGRLSINGKPYPLEGIAAQLRVSSSVIISCVGKLLDYGIAEIDNNGVLSSRRLIRDLEVRRIASENGRKGGNPKLKQISNQTEPKTKKKEIAVAIQKYQQPDREGNPRSQLKGFNHIWLSQPEIDRIRERFQDLNFTAEQKKFAVEKVDSWFAENPKKLAASSEHVTRILGWGTKAALEVKTEEGRAAKATTSQKEFLTSAEKREKTNEQTKQLIAGGAAFDIDSWLDGKVSGVASTSLDAVPDGGIDGSCGVLGSTLSGSGAKRIT